MLSIVCYNWDMNERIKQMQVLRDKGFSYGSIGKVFGISRQRVHQLLSGYDKLLTGRSNNAGWYYKIRGAILLRDEHTCQKCGARGDVLHHLDDDDAHNDLTNLITLCRMCHLKLHGPIASKGANHKKKPLWIRILKEVWFWLRVIK